jgi:PKD repeat protein
MRSLHILFLKTSLFLLVFVVSAKTYAQIDLTTCYGSCTSGDFTITRAFLVHSDGTEVVGADCSSPGQVVNAYLAFTFKNNTNSDRNGIFISGTINGTYIYKCFAGILPKKKETTFSDLTHLVQWQCGTDLTLIGTFTSWGSAGENVCDITCSGATPSKCRSVGDLTIQTPLSNDFSSSASCTSGNAFQTVSFNGSKSGGTSPYTYDWNFGDGSTHGTVEDPTHTYTSAGNFSVTFKVTDATGTFKTVTKTVTVASCCTAPTITSSPGNQQKCEGLTASFAVDYTGGSPAPTIQWQKKAPGGSFSNLTISSPYSLSVDNKTLNISNVTGLNGYQYQAVLTSGSCTPVTSGAGALTVYTLPESPHGVYHAPATCNDSTFSVTVDNVAANATYTIKDKNGNNIVGVLPGNTIHTTTTDGITFSHIPAGSGFIVSVVSDNNCSPTASPTVCGTPDNQAPHQTVKNSGFNNVVAESGPTVKAYPNPFNDRVKFVLNSPVTGNGTLEVYNIMGQKVKTVYQGHIKAGDQSFDLVISKKQQSTLIYVFRVGDKKVTGKLLQMNQ